MKVHLRRLLQHSSWLSVGTDPHRGPGALRGTGLSSGVRHDGRLDITRFPRISGIQIIIVNLLKAVLAANLCFVQLAVAHPKESKSDTTPAFQFPGCPSDQSYELVRSDEDPVVSIIRKNKPEKFCRSYCPSQCASSKPHGFDHGPDQAINRQGPTSTILTTVTDTSTVTEVTTTTTTSVIPIGFKGDTPVPRGLDERDASVPSYLRRYSRQQICNACAAVYPPRRGPTQTVKKGRHSHQDSHKDSHKDSHQDDDEASIGHHHQGLNLYAVAHDPHKDDAHDRDDDALHNDNALNDKDHHRTHDDDDDRGDHGNSHHLRTATANRWHLYHSSRPLRGTRKLRRQRRVLRRLLPVPRLPELGIPQGP
ncbi:predicted protein [Verticillium alfalfae VaMs.102]|uniref:Predicted protein n=1 Tax=Verticillium alfalfae (strain VaMs.102 / ATCC MYA-4576 / FGSC 10136) TaxID=526221 RepID=C9ST95_VERA1|nr:predicted protein [Verticillium alfalfae VaMs.102]EEY22010.1 predicted protein [Verticillium alfalfae VaMs.102]